MSNGVVGEVEGGSLLSGAPVTVRSHATWYQAVPINIQARWREILMLPVPHGFFLLNYIGALVDRDSPVLSYPIKYYDTLVGNNPPLNTAWNYWHKYKTALVCSDAPVSIYDTRPIKLKGHNRGSTTDLSHKRL